MTLRATRHLETSGSDYSLVNVTPQRKGLVGHVPAIASKFEIFVLSSVVVAVYHQVQYSKNVPFLDRVYFCVACGSRMKERLLPCTAFTDWFFNSLDGMCLQCGMN